MQVLGRMGSVPLETCFKIEGRDEYWLGLYLHVFLNVHTSSSI